MAVSGLCLALPAAAHGATASSTVSTSHVTSDFPAVKYLADPGEANKLVVAGAGDATNTAAATFLDAGARVRTVACAPLVRGAVCSTELARYYGQDYPDGGELHPGPGWWVQAVIDLGDGDDTLNLQTGIATSAGAYPGVDGTFVSGNAGDDRLDTTDGAAESASCGDGNDTVIADAADTVNADCESVTRR